MLVKDKEGDLALLANYEVNYPFKMEGVKVIKILPVPMDGRFTRKTKLKEIIQEQQDKVWGLQSQIKDKRAIIRFLKQLSSTTGSGKE